MERFVEYLRRYNKTIVNNRVEYCFQEIPQSLIDYHENISRQKKVFWTPQTFGIISHNVDLAEEKLGEFKSEIKLLEMNYQSKLLKFENVPKWYWGFISKFYGLNLFRGSIVVSPSTVHDTVAVKPTCLNGKFYIGQYAGITPESCPIFTNEEGEIFVYEAKNFRNYPQMDSEKEVKKYVKQQVKLLARWENIDSFLIEECQRLERMFIKAPSLYSIKNCAPSK